MLQTSDEDSICDAISENDQMTCETAVGAVFETLVEDILSTLEDTFALVADSQSAVLMGYSDDS